MRVRVLRSRKPEVGDRKCLRGPESPGFSLAGRHVGSREAPFCEEGKRRPRMSDHRVWILWAWKAPQHEILEEEKGLNLPSRLSRDLRCSHPTLECSSELQSPAGCQYQRVAKKLERQSGERTREEKQPASATPSSIPHFSPEQKPGGRFSSGSSTALPGPRSSTMDPGSGDKDRSSADKWSLFGPRSFQKSDSEGFATQPYGGAQKPSPMELMRMLATRKAEGPATFKPPKMDLPVMGGKKQPPRTPNLKPRDLNVLIPTSF
ncbi:putative monooxygenase p33MONOX [Myotis myotis]|uniref:putative monooxygenase p33MONOX n=1 Tax=Myotis myotis TaxID=51298 RepID=UPI00174AF37B|nr:putative monooxygenase p33MONOX [Myotis myotis]